MWLRGLLLLLVSTTVTAPPSRPIPSPTDTGQLLGAPSVPGAPETALCLASAGYTWCKATQSCERQWEVPCRDNFSDCRSCLAAQRNGVNIACPGRCDAVATGAWHGALPQGPDPCTCPPAPPCPRATGADGCTLSAAPTDDCGCPVGCPALECGPGQSCGGFAASLGRGCIAPYECVQTMGPLVADAPGECRPPCALGRDGYGNCIDPGCTLWYDGCNTCRVSADQATSACTEMFCERPGKAECRDSADPTGAPAGAVCHRFCEDGSELPVQRSCAPGLVCVAPAGMGFDSCGARASRCAPAPGGH